MVSPPVNAPHIVIFPFMAKGHTLPLLDLSLALTTESNVKVTIVTTASNANSIADHVSEHRTNIHIAEIPFPTIENLPKGCENTADLPSFDLYVPFLLSTRKLQSPFEKLLRDMVNSGDPPVCVISDFFFGWTQGVCEAMGVPRLVSHGMGALSMAICKSLWVNSSLVKEIDSDTVPIELPGVDPPFTLTKPDVPVMALAASDPDDPFTRLIEEAGQGDVNSWGVVLNSFEEMEGSYVPSFESFYVNGAKSWCVGPLFLYNDQTHKTVDPLDHNSAIMDWLDQRREDLDSVIYVAFGTQADIPDSQLDELAFGLEESGVPFILVVRSKTWSSPLGNPKGLVVREWVDQSMILSHPSVGGFLSHCGWNSVLESVAAGVPVLTWPMIAEQTLNAKLVVDGLGAGISVRRGRVLESGVVGVRREDFCEGVKELMCGEKGREARDRAGELGKMAKRAVQNGGSSRGNLKKMVAELCKS